MSMSWTARSAFLLSLAVGLTTSCQDPSDGSQVGQSTQALSGVHRVQASGAAAEQLLARGGRLIADYGAYALFDVDGAKLAGLPQDSVLLRDEYRNVMLNAGTIDALDESSQRLRATTLPASGRQLHLVQFAGTVKPEWHKALQSSGVRIVAYIPHNAYLVWGDSTSLSRVITYAKSAREVQWDGPYLNDFKLNPRVYNAVAPDGWDIQLVEDGEHNAETLARINAIGRGKALEDRSLGYVNLTVRADRDAVLSLAQQPDVVSIFPYYEPKKRDERANMIAAGQMTGNGPSGPGYLAWLTGRGFTQAQFDASGIGVDVSDSGLDNATLLPNHYALYTGGNVNGSSRVVYARLEGTPNGGSTLQGCDGHGTINAHIIGGFSTLTGGPHSDAQGFRYNLGIAPFVKVGSSVVFDPGTFTSPDFEDLQSRAYRDGMRVSSNSWGAALGGAYDLRAQRYDALVRDAQPSGSAEPNPGNQQMVIVFAAGNSGPGANTTISPASGKNVITAGAAENVHPFGGADFCGIGNTGADSANDIISFSSRGPCDDGRIKPDLMAAGTHVSGGVAQAAGQRAEPPANPNGQALGCFDASGVCGGPGIDFWPAAQQWTTASSGTSHSTPLIAGAAALVIQRMINTTGAPASPAMVKALLMSGTRYMNGTGANDNLYSNNQGMGHMDLSATLDDTARTLRDQLAADLFTASGQTRTFNVFVSDPAKPFRVTLAWTDAPGSTTGNAFNNNLDLTVTVGGNTYRGNVFSGANSVTGGTADIRNNVESVFLPAGVTGPATVTVTATNIVSDGVPGNASALDQDFALVVYNVCDTQPGAPTGATASVPGLNQIQIDWTPPAAGNVVQYNIYRSTTSGGPYIQVGAASNTTTTFIDSSVSGGTTYFYVVRAVDCAESADSNEVSATATGDCRIPPGFAGLTSAASAQASTCGVNLSWSAATPSCGGPIAYNVYRSRTAGFSPGTATRIASGVTGTSFSDAANLSGTSTYYYVVRAVETSGSSTTEESNTVERSVRPTGAITPGLTFFDDLDGNRPPSAAAYWITGGTGATSITQSTCHWQSTTRSWRFGSTTAATCPGTYANSVSATLTLGGNGSTPGINGFAFPAGSTGELVFRHGWNMENGWDGALLEYSTTGATGTFTKITSTVSATAPYITAGDYNGNANALGGTAWTNVVGLTNGAFSTTRVNVNALAGRTAWFRWRYASDTTIVAEGHYLDDVSINTSIIAACTPGATPPGAAAYYAMTLPASSQAGVAVTADLQAWDATEQVATSYNGVANLTSSDPQAIFPPAVSFSGGVASQPVSFGTLGLQTLTASDSADSSITGMAGTMVTAGPPVGLRFSVQPSDAVAGMAINPAVRVEVVDQFGNLVNTATDSVTLVLGANPSGGTLNGTTTVAALGGVATFSDLNIQQVGTGYTLFASSGGLNPDFSTPFNITPDVPAGLRFRQQPSSSVAGVPFSPTVEVEITDQYGNLNTDGSWGVFVTLENNPTGTFLIGNPFVSSLNGVASFPDIAVPVVGTGYTLAALSGFGFASSTAFDIGPNVPFYLTVAQEPTDTTVNAPISPVVVELRDFYGNLATQSFAPVSAALLGGTAGAQLLGTSTAFASAGVATFNDLAVDRAGQAYTLLLGSTGLHSTVTVAFNVGAGPAGVALQFVSQPSNAVAGTAISPAITVRVVDGSGNTVIDAAGPVTLAFGNNAGGGTLSGALTATPVSGVATFSNVSIDRSGTGYTLVASSGGLASATSGAFDIGAAAPVRLVLGTQPSNSVAGQAIAPAVTAEVRDAFGNLSNFNGPVTVALRGGNPSATLSGTTTVNAASGVATFADLSINRAGIGYALAASSGTLGQAISDSFNVSAGSASQLVFSVQPPNTVAGRAFAPAVTVQALDALGNQDTTYFGPVSLVLSGGAAGATLDGTTTVTATAGAASFYDLSIDRAGAGYNLAASSGALAATSNAFNVAPGAAVRLVFAAQPSNAMAGQAIAPAVRVEAQDALGNVNTSFNGPVTVALRGGNPSATLSGTATANASGGVATFADLSVNRSGSGYSLVASSGALSQASSLAFNVSARSATQLVYSVQPSSSVAGRTLAPAVTVQALDALGNLDTTFGGPVTVALSGGAPSATLSGTTTVNATAGTASFYDLSINRAGAGYNLAASSGALGANSNAFNVAAGAAIRLVFTAQPSNAAAGQSIGAAVTVEAQDALGNVTTDFTGTVTVALSGGNPNATLSGATSATAVAGVATFANLSVNRAGAGYNLAASASALGQVASAAFNVSPGAGTRVVYSVQPSSSVAGRPVAPAVAVQVQDALGNVDTAFSGPVTVALSGGNPAATLSGTTTVNAAAGEAWFSDLSIDRSGGGYALTATSGALTATSGAFNVAAGPATRLVFSAQPSNTTAGQAIAPAVVVEAQDALGNVDPTFSGLVELRLRGGFLGAALAGASAGATSGVASFSGVTIDRAAAGYTLVATSGSLSAATSSTFDVSAAAAIRLVFGGQPSNATSGQSIAPAVTVEARDPFGNLDTAFTGSVTVALAGGNPNASLSGATNASATAGVASFADLSIDRVGMGYVLQASAGSTAPASSNAFNVRPAAASQLVFAVQPSNAAAGRAISPAVVVEARDPQGNLDTDFNGQVTLTLAGGVATATLSGTIIATAVNGVANFPGLSVDRAGTGYTISAGAGALSSASSAFDVASAAASRLVFAAQPSSAGAGQTIAPAVVVEARDAFGNLDTTFNGSVTLSLAGGSGNATLSGTTSGTASAGVITFSDLSVNRNGRGYTLLATASGVTGGSSDAFNVSAGPPAKYAISGIGMSVTSSVEVSFTIQAYDAQDNLATDYSGTASLTSDDSRAILPATVTFTSGVASDVRVTFRSTGRRTLTATDTSTASLSASANLVVTNFPQPTVSITSPSNGASVTGPVTISAEAAVAAGTTLTRLEIFVDGTSVANGTTSTLSATWDVTQIKKDTTHLIHAVVTDAAGNVVQSTPLTVIIGAQGCGCSTGAGGADLALLAAVGAALRAIAIRRRRAKK